MPADSPTQPAPRLRQARFAVIAFFMLHGLLFASWIVRIPDVKIKLGLSDGELGLALLGAPVGAIAGQFLVGWLLSKFGSKLISIAMAVIWCAMFPLLGLAPHMLVLLAVLFFYGMLSGGLDVAMNAQAATVEKLYGRPIMAFFHGTWSVASLIAAGLGGFLAGHGVPVEWHFLGVALFVLVGVVIAQNWLVVEERPIAGEKHSFVLLPRSLILLGMLAFCVLLIEGAIGDWSAVYLRESLGSPPTEAAAAYVVFNLLMTVGRLTGDRVTLRFGSARIVRYGGLLAFVGLVLFVFSPWPYLSIAGCALIGAGIACPFPLVISAAARNTSVPPGRAISAMATVGYSGTLLGPPLIGGVAELISLRGALSLLCLAALTMLLFGTQVQASEPAQVATEVG
jgi:MFS family permease